MKCPNCSGKMEPSNASGVQTHTCLYCNGIWICRGSMDELLAIEGMSERCRNLLTDNTDASPTRKRCPSCADSAMRALAVGDVEIDFCKSCHGIFLDEGEIRALLPKSHSPKDNPVLGLILDIFLGAVSR